MARHTHTLACLVVLLAVTSSEKEQSRWSRQISSYTSDISDWVPLSGPVQREPPPPKITTPIKRQAIAEPRILTEPFPGFARPTGFGQDTFPSRTYFNSPANRQMYLQSVPSAPQNYLNDQGFGQSLRFGLSQPNYPLNQGFAAPQYTFESALTVKQRPLQPPVNPIKFETYPKQSIAPVPQTKPFINPASKPKPEEPKFIEEGNSKKKAQSLQKLKFDTFEKLPKTEPIPPKPKAQKEEVQLLYVPLEQLNRGQFNFRGPMASPHIINSDLYSQGLPKVEPLKQSFSPDFQRPKSKPIENFGSGQEYFGTFDALKDYDQVPKFSTLTSPFPTAAPTTPKPKKLKPHQPPLAIFQEAKKNGQNKVGDVLSSLKNANSIAVLDTVNPLNAPKVFIGPYSLTPPEGFVKFELPYLSNIENSDKKMKQLPFFVAPLSYNTPNGFAKIPFPSPHVGSVVINSLIQENPSTQQTYSTPPAYSTPSLNSYKEQPLYKQELKPVTPRPSFNYYSTVSPKTNAPLNQQSNYYSFEPQTVTSLSPFNQPTSQPVNQAPHKGSYFLSNVNGEQYNPSQYVNFPAQNEYRDPEPVKQYVAPKLETTTTTRATTTTTTPKPSTYSSQLLETHNPYSINQAFHFSTPLDYHSYFDEFKETYAPPGINLEVPKSSTVSVGSNPSSIKPQEIVTEKPRQATSPPYVQNYSPEIQYESEVQGNRYSVYNNDYARKPEIPNNAVSAENVQPINQTPEPHYIGNVKSEASYENLTETIINKITGPSSEIDNSKGYEQYETSYNSNEYSSSTTSSTTTTTTRRPATRTRGRPRYTTAKPDSNEATHSTTRATYTRKPLRERRPLPPRSRYEPNKIASEKTTKKSFDSNESTTKSSRTRTRGRIQYKPSDNDEYYDKRNKGQNSKEEDLAYQRDILHQNYPVTLMERTSTVDIEAITEPSQPRISSTKTLETAAENYDSENAYAHESAAVSHLGNSEVRDEIPNYTSRIETQYEDTSAPKYSTRNEEFYQSRSSAAPTQAFANREESMEKQEDFPRHTTPQRIEKTDISSYATELSSINTEQPTYSINIEQNPEDITTIQDTEISKIESQEGNGEGQPEENVVQTTPSYNRVRVRPGVIRQYHQASSTESSKIKSDRRRPVQAITYRPAFDRRRTTMRIDEIEADLKTKQVHSRSEVQDYRHPVYKPDPSTESTTTSSTQETTKRGHFKRRRPTYTTTSTEAASTKKIYEVKNRFRGRRPTTEKPIDKLDVQAETTSTTVRNTPYSRYSHRPRLSERYNKKPEQENDETEDQDSNYSINRPKYVAPETDQWSPKITSESFKPFNPNDIIDETKFATTERRSDVIEDGELDIITARNNYDDILISVTPATNTRGVKKIPDIPPTLEALVEQSKTTKSDSTDNMSTFETMLEEVMKSLEEQDKDEYTSNVMKHKGGEIGEIPPEKVIPSDDEYAPKLTTALDQEATTVEPAAENSTSVNEEVHQKDKPKGRRRGFWKKVKVRPVNTESIEVAESQYYPNTVNRLGESVKKNVHDKLEKEEKPRISVTTYKPTFQFIKDMIEADDVSAPEADQIVDIDIPKINKQTQKDNSDNVQEVKQTTTITEKEITTEKPSSVGDVDLGTGSPDPTLIDNMYQSTPTEPTASEGMFGMLNKASEFSIMDYLFGTTSSDSNSYAENKNETIKDESKKSAVAENIEITTEQLKPKIVTTETTYIPEEITTVASEQDDSQVNEKYEDNKKIVEDEKAKDIEVTEPPVENVVTSESSFMNPSNVVSTSMSTEISHETEICFRGKCIKTSKDIL